MIEILKAKLDNKGYLTIINKNNFLVVGKKLNPIVEIEGVFRFDAFCTIHVTNDSYEILYGKMNIQEEISFSDESSVIDWIQKEFRI